MVAGTTESGERGDAMLGDAAGTFFSNRVLIGERVDLILTALPVI
jgi:hypothetical protein